MSKEWFLGKNADPAPLAAFPWRVVLAAMALGIVLAIACALLLAVISGRSPCC